VNTTLYRIPTIETRGSRRIPILAAASGLVAAGAVAVTLAVAGGGSDADAGAPAFNPAETAVHAHPDRATLYQRSVEVEQPAPSIDGSRSAERFHHLR
jgi:hypothetical protein